MHCRFVEIDRTGVETQQDMHAAAGEVFELVNLIRDLERFCEVMSRRVTLVFDVDGHLLMPWVLIEVSADQVAILGPLIKRIGCAVNADETSARSDEVEERAFLRLRKRQFS